MRSSHDIGILARVVLVYVAFSALWILVSDLFVQSVAGDLQRASHYQSAKGLLFVAASAAVIFLLLRRELRARRAAESGREAVVEEQERTYRELRASEARYRSLFEHSLDALLITSPEGQIRAANPAACRIFGRTEGELRELGRDGIVDTADPRLKKYLHARERDGEAFGTITMMRGDGTTFEGEISSSVFDTPSGKRSSTIIRDISERIAVERALERSRELLNETQSLAKVGGWEFDPKTGTGTWTDEVARIHDIHPQAETSVDLGLSVYRGEHRDAIERAIREAIELGTSYDLTLEMVTPAGTRKWVHTIGKPTIEEGNVVRVSGAIQDITAQKETEIELARHRENLEQLVETRTAELEGANRELSEARDQAEAADRLKSAFLATMSHELRTPLNSIIGFTGILLQQIPGELNAEQRKQLEMVRSSARHLLALINDVLDISKIEAGQLTVEQERFDLADSARTVARSIEQLANAKGVSLTTDITESLEDVLGDKRRFEQVLLNLLGNAIKFTASGGVTLTVGRAGDGMVESIVRDTGVGIAPHELEAIFMPFHQVENGTSRRHEGTGLGLSVSRRLVGLMGGRIWVSSEPGKGSEFGFTVPTHGLGGGEG